MYGIVVNDDHYLTGEYYKLETDEELLAEDPEDYDIYNYMVISEELKYKKVTSEKQIEKAITGLRGDIYNSVIRVKASDVIYFKIKDKIKLFQNETALKIINIRPVDNEDNDMTAIVLPGLYALRETDEIYITLR